MGYATVIFDGEINTFEEWGLMLSEVYISDPDPQIISLDIPGRSGVLDLSEVLTGQVAYKNRSISLTFDCENLYDDWPALKSKISNYLHGKNRRIVFDNDTGFYYYGRFTVDHRRSDEATATIAIDGTVDPYKYETELTEHTLTASGSTPVTLYGSRMPVNPSITVASATTVTLAGTAYPLAAGANLLPAYIVEGENVLTFAGGGAITISYRRGSF